MPANLLEYFPEVDGDGLRVSWASNVDSKSRLASVLRGPASILEGNVSMSSNSRYPVPVMACPPAQTSDITLEEWLHETLRANKGIQLNFRSTEVVEPACRVLARLADHFQGPVILSAEIVNGPNSSSPPIDAWTFLTLCRTRFPKAFISLGWQTEVLSGGYLKVGYTREMTDKMIALIKEYSLAQPLLFPICASLLQYSMSEVQRLVFHVPHSSLVVYSTKGVVPIVVEDLMAIRNCFARDQIFYALSEEELECLFAVI